MRPTPIALVLGAVLLLACASSLSVGPEGLPFSGELLALGREDPALALTILTEIRLPRVVIGILVGGTLGLSGAALQGLLRNPLVEPGLIGVSSGATLGAVIAIYFGLSAQFALLLPLGVVVHRLTLTPERTLAFLAMGVALLPFSCAFQWLLRRGPPRRAALLSALGRVLVLAVLLLGVSTGLLSRVVVLMLPALALVFVLFELLAGAIYAGSRNVALIALIDAAWLALIVAAFMPMRA